VGRLGLVGVRFRARRRASPGGARSRLARYLAPVLFLLAVTGVVLLVRSSLRSDSTAVTTTRSTPAKRSGSPVETAGRVRVPAQYYVIQSGDTLGAIAGRFATTVDVLLALNPGVEPTTLRPGERLRIK
jgi:LysM repeat protein